MADAQITSGDGVVIDKTKSNEQYIKDAEGIYIIPSLVREKFPDLIKLVYETESMNDEEREYWLQILPIMGEEQIVKFRNILVTEKEQLNELDQEYETEMSRLGGKPVKDIDELKLKEKMAEIEQAETKNEAEEEAEENELLKKLDAEG